MNDSGLQFTYVYDGIGNRKQWKWGGNQNGENLVTSGNLRNMLNQYTSVYSDSTIRWITGEAAANANVFVNGAWAWRKGTFFGREIDQGNQTGPSWKEVTVEAKLPPSGGNMVVSSESGHLLAPPRIASCQYDLDGNLTNDGLWSYSWDGENRLKRITSTSTVPNAAKRQFDYTYDFEGRRVSRKVYTWDAVGQVWITTASPPQIFLYDGWNLIATKGDWGLNQRFVWGTDLSGTLDGAGGVGGLLAMTDVTAGKSYSYVSDCNGNISALVDSANGTVVAQYEYGPFGEPLRASGPMGKVNPFRWSSKYTENESGMVYYGYRFYNPTIGRWLNRDPIEEEGGWNLYAFCANEPIGQIDPLGLDVFYNLQVALDATRGAADSLSFGISGYLRDYIHGDNGEVVSVTAYQIGEGTEIVVEITITGGSALLKKAAKDAIAREAGEILAKEMANRAGQVTAREAERKAKQRISAKLRDEARRKVAEIGNSNPVHHRNPLLGHPYSGNKAIFPTLGVNWFASSRLNLIQVPKRTHDILHFRMEAAEKVTMAFVNPGMTSIRAVNNYFDISVSIENSCWKLE